MRGPGTSRAQDLKLLPLACALHRLEPAGMFRNVGPMIHAPMRAAKEQSECGATLFAGSAGIENREVHPDVLRRAVQDE